jgi:hypothetical protein
MMELGLTLTKTNVGASPWMDQVSEMRSGSAVQQRTLSEAGTQTEAEAGNESVIRKGLMTQARLASE